VLEAQERVAKMYSETKTREENEAFKT